MFISRSEVERSIPDAFALSIAGMYNAIEHYELEGHVPPTDARTDNMMAELHYLGSWLMYYNGLCFKFSLVKDGGGVALVDVVSSYRPVNFLPYRKSFESLAKVLHSPLDSSDNREYSIYRIVRRMREISKVGVPFSI